MEGLLTRSADVGERAFAQSHQRFGKAKRPIHSCSHQGNNANSETDQSDFLRTQNLSMSRRGANKVAEDACGGNEDDRGNDKHDNAGVCDDFRSCLPPEQVMPTTLAEPMNRAKFDGLGFDLVDGFHPVLKFPRVYSANNAAANCFASNGCKSSGCSPTPMNLMGRPSSF